MPENSDPKETRPQGREMFPVVGISASAGGLEALSGEEALREIPSFSPDIVLVDISLPGIDGLEMIRKLKPQCPDACILVVTGHDIEPYKQTALEAGVHGIVSKMDDDELLRAVGELSQKMD